MSEYMPEKIYARRHGDDDNPMHGFWIDCHDPIGEPETIYYHEAQLAAKDAEAKSNLDLAERHMNEKHAIRAQLAAKDAEIARLKKQEQHFGRLAREHYEQLQAQIDAQAATIARQQKALEKLSDHHKYGWGGQTRGSVIRAVEDISRAALKEDTNGEMHHEFVSDYYRPARCANCGMRREHHADLKEGTNG